MGNCAKYTSNPRSLSRTETMAVLDKYGEQPADTASLANSTLPSLDIRPLLRKVKVKNSPQKRIGVRFLIAGNDEILLPEKAVDENSSVKWKIEQNFQYICTEYELRKKFLIIELLSGGMVLSTLKINMYLINIGPYHLDFEMPMNIQSKPRISFDFKMSQVVNMKIETENLQIYEMQEHVGQQYAFSIKSIFGNNPKVSQMSSIYKVDHEQLNNNVPIASWSNQMGALPSIQGSVPFYEFHYATLKYNFYKIDKMSNKQPQKPIAECFVSFVKLLGFDSTSSTVRDRVEYDVKNITLEEKLWSGGKQCGRVKIRIKFDIQKHLKQMLVCVRTQFGVQKMSPVYQVGAGNTKHITKQIAELQTISQKLMNEEGELEKKRSKARREGGAVGSITGLTKQSYNSIQKCLDSELKLLQKSVKQTIKIYDYANPDELLKGQYFLLKLGERQLRYINEGGEQTLEDLKWKVLRSLVDRGEFTLNYMGFDSKDKDVNNMDPTFQAKKKDIAFKFQDLHYKFLQLTLKTLGIKAANQQKKFAEQFCAVAYIRIPQFRQKILSLIEKPSDPQIQEWRGTDFSLKSKYTDFKSYLPGENTFQILFDWERYFYDYIKNEPDYKSNIHKLDIIMQNNREWQARISKRRGAFFAFIREWVAFVTRISVRIVHSNWKHFPGYIQIIRCFMAEMKIRQVSEYPPSIKMACYSLLSNENLLNIFVTIIFSKTSINNNFDVIKILDLTNGFFHALRKQNKRIPSTFNYTFFYNGIKLVIENLYSYSTAKALHLLYEQFQFFPYEFRIELCNYLLGRLFFKLFLHWSYNVRVIFHHLMIVRIYKFFTNELKADNLDPETRQAIRNISARYSDLLIILENVKKIKGKQFVPSTEDELYKKLRNNLRKKRKIQRKGADENTIQQQMLSQIPDTNLATNNRDNENTARIMSELARPQLERYDSQIITKDIKIALAETPIKQKDQIIRKKMTYVNEQQPIQSVQQIEQAPKKKAPVAMNTAAQIQMPVLSQQDMRYATPGMIEFNSTSSGYLDNIKKNKGDPMLKMEIMLDSSQMKPQEFNDVEEW